MASCQRDIDRLHKGALSWGLFMNTNKCVVVKFHWQPMDSSGLPSSGMYYLNDIPIPVKDSAVDLEVHVDSTLKFHQHIHNIVQKAGGMAQNLLKLTVNRYASFLINLYVTHIQPIIKYYSAV